MKSLSTTTKLGSPNRMPQATISRAGANGQFGAIRAEGHRGSFIARTVQLLCVFVPSIVLTPQCAFFAYIDFEGFHFDFHTRVTSGFVLKRNDRKERCMIGLKEAVPNS